MTDWPTAWQRILEVARAPSADPRVATLLVLIATATLTLFVLLGVLLVTRPGRVRTSLVEDEEGNLYELERAAERIDAPSRRRASLWIGAALLLIAAAVGFVAWSLTGP